MDFLSKTFVTLVAFLNPIGSVLGSVGALIIIDALSGIWAAKKQGKKITSYGFRRSVGKFCVYFGAILVAFLIEHVVGSEVIPMVKPIAAALALTEGKSILENLHRITGVDIFKIILDKLQGQSIKQDPPK